MNRSCYGRRAVTTVAAIALAAAMPLTAMASHSHAAHPNSRPNTMAPVAFVFGREGGNIMPLSVTIRGDGRVVANGSGSVANGQIHLSQDTLAGLMKLARAEGFFALPARLVGHGLPDVGGTFISIHTATGTKTVYERYVHNAGFDQLYAVLMAVAGMSQ